MNLLAFRVRNYRSIVDTNWCKLSSDNVTGLIGQNESGKTSILESLLSFANGKISEDVLRSDESLPEISMKFSLDARLLEALKSDWDLPNGILESLREDGTISLTRTWSGLNDSTTSFWGSPIPELYEKHQKRIEQERSDLLRERKSIQETRSRDLSELEELNKRRETISKRVTELEAAIAAQDSPPAILSELQTATDDAARATRSQLGAVRDEMDELTRLIQLKTERLDKQQAIFGFLSEWEEAESKAESQRGSLDQAMKVVNETEAKVRSAIQDPAKKLAETELKDARSNLQQIRGIYEAQSALLENKLKVFQELLRGASEESAIQNVQKTKESAKQFMTLEKFLEEIRLHLPGFELFQDYSSLLPNSMDLDDLRAADPSVEGQSGVRNFLKVIGLDATFFEQPTHRIQKQKMKEINRTVTVNFQEFWSQRIGKSNKIGIEFDLEHHSETQKGKQGKPYLEFWINDGTEKLYPKQRSAGVRWFLSFYLQLKAYQNESGDGGLVLLIDEPGSCLHARAQENVLKVFDTLKKNIQIVYTTHSPYLLKLDQIYRLLAIQRSNESDEQSETKVLTAHELGAASTDTLSPLYTLMGANFSDQQVIKKTNNIILEEISAFYYLKAFAALTESKQEMQFLPATGCANIPQLANLLLGWGIEFIVILDDEPSGRRIYTQLKSDLFPDDGVAAKKLLKLKGMHGIEDIFERDDFKKWVLQDDAVELKTSNSEYMKSLSKGVAALNFFQRVKQGDLKMSLLNKKTQDRISGLVGEIGRMLESAH